MRESGYPQTTSKRLRHDLSMAVSEGVLPIELHFGADLASCDVVDRVQHVVHEMAPKFCADLRVLRFERDREAVAVEVTARGLLREIVVAWRAPR